MTPAANAVQEMLKSPTLVLEVAELETFLERERAAYGQFLDAVTEDGKHEFINGEHVVHGPAKNIHGMIVDNVVELLRRHSRRMVRGSVVRTEKALVKLTRNAYEPDVCWFSPEKAAGFTPEMMVFPAPDLVVEVLSPSTAHVDRGLKTVDYAAHGVAEYWIIDPDTQILEQRVLRQPGQYAPPIFIGLGGILHSAAIKSLVFPVSAVFDEEALDEYLSQPPAPPAT